MRAGADSGWPPRAAGGVLIACLALPWINPFAPGPSPNVAPWLASAALCMLAFFIAAPALPSRRGLLVAAAVAAFVMLRPAASALERSAIPAAMVLVGLAYGVGRGSDPAGASPARLIAWAWLAAALVSSAIALLQYFDMASALHPWVYAAQPGEAMANLRQRNQLASLITIGLAALLWLASRPQARPWQWLPALLLLAAANAATTSRTGLVQWLLMLALALIWRAPNRARLVGLCAGALAAYATAAFVLPAALERITGIPAETLLGRLSLELGCASRKVLWHNVVELVAQRPLAGWGWGELDYAHFMHLYGDSPRFCDILDNAHSLPLHLAVELGLPFAVLTSGAVMFLALRARPWHAPDPQRQLAWAVLMVLATHSMLEYPLWYGPFQMALGLALGLLASGAATPLRMAGASVRGAVLAGGLALVALASWDYARVSQIYLPPERRLRWWGEDAMESAQRSWLFASQARFAAVTLAPLTRENAEWNYATALAMLHYSPEPRIIERVIEASTMLGRDDEPALYLARLRAAFPQDYEKWRAVQGR